LSQLKPSRDRRRARGGQANSGALGRECIRGAIWARNRPFCFPRASPDKGQRFPLLTGHAVTCWNGTEIFGAGEGIRTLDPNLGKSAF
jgi:hypothetical protein